MDLFSCPHCQASLIMPDQCQGKELLCPRCHNRFKVPEAAASQQHKPKEPAPKQPTRP